MSPQWFDKRSLSPSSAHRLMLCMQYTKALRNKTRFKGFYRTLTLSLPTWHSNKMEAATHLKYTASLVSLFTGLWGLYYLYQQNKKKSKWVHVGYLDEIFIYPIKGGKGKSVTSAYLGPLGLKSGLLRDREFMIVDKKYTQKRKLKLFINWIISQ